MAGVNNPVSVPVQTFSRRSIFAVPALQPFWNVLKKSGMIWIELIPVASMDKMMQAMNETKASQVIQIVLDYQKVRKFRKLFLSCFFSLKHLKTT